MARLVYQRKPGGVYWCDIYDKDGKRIRRSTRCMDEAAAVMARLQMEEKAKAGALSAGRRPRPPRPRLGVDEACFVYFIRAGESQMVKIGIAADPKQRMNDLQVGNHERLALIGKFKTGTDPWQEERNLHRRFAHLALHGEWFRLGPEIESFIRERCRRSRHL